MKTEILKLTHSAQGEGGPIKVKDLQQHKQTSVVLQFGNLALYSEATNAYLQLRRFSDVSKPMISRP